ncbi:MAG: diguanylate cyclase, partial [Gammaproteobacteria bacterium]
MRLSTKYGLAISATAMITATALGALLYYQIHNVLQERAVEAQLSAAHSILSKIDDALAHARRDMHILVEDEFLKVYVASPADRTETNHKLLKEELEERGKITGPWDDLMVVDRNGTYLLTTEAHEEHDSIDRDPAAYAAFKAAMKGETYNSDVVVSDHSGQRTLLFAAPIREKSEDENGGRIIGAVVAQYRWSTISDILKKGFKSGSVFLFDRTGKVIAEHVQGHKMPPPSHFARHAEVQQALLASGAHESVHQSEGADTVLSTHVRQAARDDVADNGWGLAIEQSEDVIFAPARHLALQAALIVVVVLVALAIALTLLSYRFTSPLRRLTRITERIGQGDFQQHVDYDSNDEVGTLAKSINTMTDHLEAGRAELVAAKNRIQGIVDTVQGILYTATPHNLKTVFISPATDTLLGFKARAFLEDPALRINLVLEEDREKALADIDTARQQNTDFVITYRMRRKDDNAIRWFEDRGSWEHDASGRIVALHGVMTDITTRKQHEEQLAHTTRALNILHSQDTLLTHAATETELVQGVCSNIVDERVYQFAWVGMLSNERPTGLRIVAEAGSDTAFAADIKNTHIDVASSDCLPCRAIREKQPYMIQDLTERTTTDEWTLQALAHHYASLISLPLVSDDKAIGSLNIYSKDSYAFDTDELKLLKEIASNLAYGITALRTQALHNQAQELLTHQAFHDGLTDLPNRALFMHTLQMALAHVERSEEVVAVLFIDLDDFKLVNDTLGHAAGDELLRQVGERIHNNIRGSDMVARQGGDEFIVLMSSTNSRDPEETTSQDSVLLNVAKQAQRLIDQMKQPFIIEGHRTYIGASIGIAISPHDARDTDTLLQYADSAMYRAKELGKGNYAFYSAELTERQHQRMSVANRLHQALERQDFVLYFPPVIELATGTMTGVEALTRW